MTEKVLISVVGPTAIGKTKMAIQLAQHYKTEIISADSRQFFQEMNIGTAVPTEEELTLAPHHFIQHKSIHEPYSVGDFEKDALARLNTLFSTHDVAIMVGGSGLYVDAVVHGLDNFPKITNDQREILSKKSIKELQELLKEKDPVYFSQVDIFNPHRLIRALEVCLESGKPYSDFLGQKKKPRFFKTVTISLYAERSLVYERINQRVDEMVSQGLIEEVKKLLAHKNLNALQTVGYRELFQYFEGVYNLETAIEEIKKNTRRFAKRQLTWFKKKKDALWFHYNTPVSKIIESIEYMLKNEHYPIIYIMGVSGCGKSTIGQLLAHETGLHFFDGDDYHPKENVKKMSQGFPLDDNDRAGWLAKLNQLAQEYESPGAVIACSALKQKYRDQLSKNLSKVVFVHLEGSFDQIKERMEKRAHFMPPALLQSQFNTLEPPKDAVVIKIEEHPDEMVKTIKKALNKNAAT
jgi:tRNA dimethylallyltransferase